ncbi:MAG TPA: diphosphate--fructose-6-phosphate 1-phosphotransferase [Victivallales bacterium]|nr:diphosphate--fructose-6-phosphate 1-phosphotransferase [Victivallales bacterium]HRU01672.1 diphosphate--fructose-6-phosphate 1-phosphotransferase [Victivallales bacterium]
MSEISSLQKERLNYKAKLPKALLNGAIVKAKHKKIKGTEDSEKIKGLFPNLFEHPVVSFSAMGEPCNIEPALKVGVVLSGGQAPGGHNVIAGIFDGIKSANPDSKLFGFLGGPSGLVDCKYKELTKDIIDQYRNTGGFDIIGSGRTKIETEEQFQKAKESCEKLGIHAIVIIGGDDSNTNACLLAEYFLAHQVQIRVIGCPKTIDGDLKNEYIETSFGFDTASKVYSELIGNIARDANSAKKYWHFIRLMGRSASHITLECALQTHPNIAIISEEVAEKKKTLDQIAEEIVSVIVKRAEKKMNYGIALIPEGLIEFIPEMKALIRELNDLMARETAGLSFLNDDEQKLKFVKSKLTTESSKLYESLPSQIQLQLIKDRDPHGNVQVSLIETEKLLIEIIQKKLSKLRKTGEYVGKFSVQTHFLGYEGRCAAPSNFDADYCYSLGFTAAALIANNRTGYMAYVGNLAKTASEWICGGIPLTTMMNIERRHGEDKPVIKKALVDLKGKPFAEFAKNREKWAVDNFYLYPGPIQYFGPETVSELRTKTLILESKK